MKMIFTATMGCLILLGLIFSFSAEMGLEDLFPGLETMKTTIVAVVFLVGAVAGLFHRFHKFKNRNLNE